VNTAAHGHALSRSALVGSTPSLPMCMSLLDETSTSIGSRTMPATSVCMPVMWKHSAPGSNGTSPQVSCPALQWGNTSLPFSTVRSRSCQDASACSSTQKWRTVCEGGPHTNSQVILAHTQPAPAQVWTSGLHTCGFFPGIMPMTTCNKQGGNAVMPLCSAPRSQLETKIGNYGFIPSLQLPVGQVISTNRVDGIFYRGDRIS